MFALLTAMADVLYWLGGMTPLDAVVHTTTTRATTGFANSDVSIGAYAAKWLLCVGMLLGGPEILAVLVLLTQMFWGR